VSAVARLLLGFLPAALAVQPIEAQTISSPALDPGRVEAFFDDAWAKSLTRDGVVPGAVVVVVHRGDILLKKGYGVRDAATSDRTDPDRTRIRIGSTSKLFAALTALALADAGRIDLDRDVNDYLTTVRVPRTFDAPVTLRTLLSHRSGFDADISGFTTFAANDVAVRPEVYERRLIRVRPPNREYGYDNLGVGLMGHLAAVVNGTSFAQAVEQHVIRPLALESTTVGVPDWQREHLAACHTWDAGGALRKCVSKPMREGFQAAGDITTTGFDMARFLMAMLNEACLDGRCVLARDTFRQFTDLDLNRLHPLARGLGFIVYEKDGAGRLALGHDGGQDGFTSSLILFPQTNTGVFMTLFSNAGIPTDSGLSQTFDLVVRMRRHNLLSVTSDVERRFAETFLPPPAPRAPARVPAAAADLDLTFLDGTYVTTQLAGATLLSRFLRVAVVLDVAVRDGQVWVDGTGPLEHTGGGVLRTRGGDARWLFTRTPHDVFLQRPSDPPFAMHVRKGWHWDARVTVLPLAVPMLLALPALLFGVVTRRSAPSRAVGYLLAFAGAAVIVGLYFEVEHFAANYFPQGPTAALFAWRLLLNLGWLAAVAALWRILSNRRELLGGVGSLRGAARVLLVVLFAISALSLVVLLPYWGLVGNLRGI
jgi:CubicO group peptidase (beta-lactamase class C family)